MLPDLSIVIPTRNRPHFLVEALASVALQRAPNVEVVVVNDAGPDVSGQVDAARAARLRVQLVTLPESLGVAAARNVGVAASTGAYLAFLDDDDVYLPGHLDAVFERLESTDADGVYTSTAVCRERVAPGEAVPDPSYVFDYPFDPDLLGVASYLPIHSVVVRSFRDTSVRFREDALGDWDCFLQLVHGQGYRLEHVDVLGVVYHRIAGEDSLTRVDPASQARFMRLTWREWKRWPPRTEKVRRYREYLTRTYMRAGTGGRELPLMYQERCLRLLANAWYGIDPEDDLVERMVAAREEVVASA